MPVFCTYLLQKVFHQIPMLHFLSQNGGHPKIQLRTLGDSVGYNGSVAEKQPQ